MISDRLNRISTISSNQLIFGRDHVNTVAAFRIVGRDFSDSGKNVAGDSSLPIEKMENNNIQDTEVITNLAHDPLVITSESRGQSTVPHQANNSSSSSYCEADNSCQEPLYSRSTHVVESIGSAVNATKQQAVNYTHEINRAYAEIEHDMMRRINEVNQRRFRLVLLSTVLFVVWVVSAFGETIRKMLSDQTAGLAKETLENESLKVQTQELAMAVVQTVLNDKDVTAHAASFLREASVVPETQEALLALTLHVLQHPDSLKEFSILVKKLIEVVANDKVCSAMINMCLFSVRLSSICSYL